VKNKRPKLKDTPEKQHARFVEAAKKAEADERPEALDRAFAKIAKKRTNPRHQ
jgi:hypothetical protein